MHTMLFLLLLTATYAASDFMLQSTLNGNDRYLLDTPEFLATVKITLVFMSLFFLLKGFSWILVGHLTALGDTKFIMYVNGLTHWVGYILPIYLLVRYYEAGAITGWTVIAINSFIVAAVFWYRSSAISRKYAPTPIPIEIE